MKLTHRTGQHASPQIRRPHDVVLCAEPGILITEKYIQVRGAWHPVDELTNLGLGRGPSGPVPVACVISGAAVATVGETTRLLGPVEYGGLVGAGSAVFATVMILAAILAYLHRPHELWAQSRGEWMLIFTSRDAVQFGKVRRTLERAMRGEED